MTSPDDSFNRIMDSSEKWYHDIAITCNQCNAPLLVEYNLDSKELTAYELDLTKNQKQIVHLHQCNDELANSVIKAVATNKRLLQDKSPGDHHYMIRRDSN